MGARSRSRGPAAGAGLEYVATLLAVAGLLLGVPAPAHADPSSPDPVFLGLFVSKLYDVNIITSSFKCDVYLSYYWSSDAPKLAAQFTDGNGSVLDLEGPKMEFVSSIGSADETDVWADCVELTAEDAALTPRLLQVPNVSNDSWIQCDARLIVLNYHLFHLQAFPFDEHVLTIDVEPRLSSSDDVQLVPIWATNYSFLGPVQLQDYAIVNHGYAVDSYFYDLYQTSYSRFSFTIDIRRLESTYTRRTIVGVVILYCLALLLFLLKPNEINRVIGTLTVFLAMVTYSFVVEQQTPQISYLTRLDNFIILNYAMLVALVFLHAIIFQMTILMDSHKRAAAEAAEFAAADRSRVGQSSESGLELQQMSGVDAGAGQRVNNGSKSTRDSDAHQQWFKDNEGKSCLTLRYMATRKYKPTRWIDLVAFIAFVVAYAVLSHQIINAGSYDDLERGG